MRVQLVDGVGLAVVIPEVLRFIDVQPQTGHAERDDRSDVRARPTLHDGARLDPVEQSGDLLHDLHGGVRAREAESLRLEHAAVGLDGEHVLLHIGLVRVAVPSPASTAILLVRPPDNANRAARCEPKPLQQLYRFPRDHDAAAVIHRATAHVPRIDVAAEHDHLVRLLRADDLAHHVA